VCVCLVPFFVKITDGEEREEEEEGWGKNG
jgi:hypothetical protein